MTTSARHRFNSNARRIASWCNRFLVRDFISRFQMAGITTEDAYANCRLSGWISDFQLREIETTMRREVNWSLVAEILNASERPAPARSSLPPYWFSGPPCSYVTPNPDPTPRRHFTERPFDA